MKPIYLTIFSFYPYSIYILILNIKQWAQSEARARLTLQADGKLDQPVFGVHYDTVENKYDFESNNPDNPFNEDDDDDDGKFYSFWIHINNFVVLVSAHNYCIYKDDDDDDDEEEEDDE